MPSSDKSVVKRNGASWYARNKTRQIKRQIERVKELRVWLLEYKRTQFCFRCGMSFADRPECCDFHHTDRALKVDNVSVMASYSRGRAMEEVAKCAPICANCHRTEHKNKGGLSSDSVDNGGDPA